MLSRVFDLQLEQIEHFIGGFNLIFLLHPFNVPPIYNQIWFRDKPLPFAMLFYLLLVNGFEQDRTEGKLCQAEQ